MPSDSPLSTDNSQEHLQLLKAFRESEILRELSELLASSLDPTHILQILVKRTTEVCNVQRCAVWLLDEARTVFRPSAYHLAASHLNNRDVQAADNIWWHYSSLPFNSPLIHRLLLTNGILIEEDLGAEPSMRKIAENFLVRSVLLVALVREGRPVGMMCIDDPGQLRSFPEDLQQLVRSIGQQAAIAIDNARLYQQAQAERQRAERLIGRAQSIYQVAMAVNSGSDLATVLNIAAEHLVHGLSANGAAIVLLEHDTLSLVGQSNHHPQPHSGPLASATAYIPSANLADLPHCIAAAEQKMPLFVPVEEAAEREKLWYHQLGLDNVMIIPLIVGDLEKSETRDDSTPSFNHTTCPGFAFVGYHRLDRYPSPGQYAFARDIAAQCALAIEKANLLAEAHHAAALATERANTLDAVFNAMTEGIIGLDMAGHVMVSNRTASHFLGVPQRAHGQLTHYLKRNPIYTLQGRPLPPENFPLSRALRGERVRGERFMTRRADGSERSVEVNIAPLYDGEARQIGIVSAFRDITEQVRIEQRIRHALDTMLHAAEEVSNVRDIREILHRVLAMTMTTLTCERGVVQIFDEEQQTFTPLLSIGFTIEAEEQWLQEQQAWLTPQDDHLAEFRSLLLAGHATLVSAEQFKEEPNPFTNTMVLAAPITHNSQLLGVMLLDRSLPPRTRKKPGSRKHSTITKHNIPHPFSVWDIAVAEGIAQFAGLAIEQTRWQQEAEIARTNEAIMRESNALKDEFLAITAHEFRTPLTVILAHSQMMERVLRRTPNVDQTLRDKLQDSISFIDIQGHQLTNIVNTFLEVTRLNRGQLTLSLEEVNLEEVVKQSVANHSATSPIHQISYKIEQSQQPYLVDSDKPRLQQIFANLLQNAIKYSPLGGPITISLKQCKHGAGQNIIEICVEDKGIGIPKEAQPRLFERFYRAPNIEGSGARGVGLGLYVVAELLRLHGGTIRVESSGIEGEGSRFIFTLPLLERQEHSDE